MIDNEVYDLNTMNMDFYLKCPYCNKGKFYSYDGSKGKGSSLCNICRNIVLWDFDKREAYKATTRKYVS